MTNETMTPEERNAAKRAAKREAKALAGQEVKVRDTVIVTGLGAPITATVVKAARVWLDITEVGDRRPMKFRLRRDTRTDEMKHRGYVYNGSLRWYTVAEWEERESQRAAWTAVREQGITVNGYSDWNERIEELAARLAARRPVATSSGTGHVSPALVREIGDKSSIALRTDIGCDLAPGEASHDCAGRLNITTRYGDVTNVHFSEAQRVALIEALGGVA